jgi:hypothetical protein
MEGELMDFITIFNLMKQAPEFSMFLTASFLYLLFYFIKTQGEKKIIDMITPLKQDISDIKNELKYIKQNTCPKNGV